MPIKFAAGVVTRGIREMDVALKDAEKQLGKDYAKKLERAAFMVHKVAVKSIRKTSPGEKQVRYDQKRNVTASKPGDPPNTDTGKLIQSVEFEVFKKSLQAFVGTNLEYGKFLELGTVNMAARPWLKPAVTVNRKKMKKIFRKKPKWDFRAKNG